MTDTSRAAESVGPEAPEPPWLARRATRAPRTPLDRDSIVRAAIRVLDREGVANLSMRRVAAELGVGAASLYWHVPSKAVLIDLVLDRVIAELPLPPPDPGRWREQLREHAYAIRTTLARHRDLARLTMGRVPIGPSLVRVIEWQLALLRGAGLPDRVATLTGDLLSLYVGAFAFEDSVHTMAPTESEADGGDFHAREQFYTMMRDYLASLPPDRFPHTTALVDELMLADREQRFQFGLDVLIDGLAAQADDRRAHGSGRS